MSKTMAKRAGEEKKKRTEMVLDSTGKVGIFNLSGYWKVEMS